MIVSPTPLTMICLNSSDKTTTRHLNGIPDSWSRYLLQQTLNPRCDSQTFNCLQNMIDNRLIKLAWERYGMSFAQGIPDPWKNIYKKYCHCLEGDHQVMNKLIVDQIKKEGNTSGRNRSKKMSKKTNDADYGNDFESSLHCDEINDNFDASDDYRDQRKVTKSLFQVDLNDSKSQDETKKHQGLLGDDCVFTKKKQRLVSDSDDESFLSDLICYGCLPTCHCFSHFLPQCFCSCFPMGHHGLFQTCCLHYQNTSKYSCCYCCKSLPHKLKKKFNRKSKLPKRSHEFDEKMKQKENHNHTYRGTKRKSKITNNC